MSRPLLKLRECGPLKKSEYESRELLLNVLGELRDQTNDPRLRIGLACQELFKALAVMGVDLGGR
jgi:hypothetical protein